MSARTTTKVRVPKDLIYNLRTNFPGMNDANLIRMVYNTSLVRPEVYLKKVDFTNKTGKFLYGKAWKK